VKSLSSSEVNLEKIRPSDFKPRSTSDSEKIKELMHSIKKLGLVQPVILRPKGDSFEIVVGDRRSEAARRVGMTKIPAIIRDVSDREALEIILAENIHREDLSAVDKGRICKMLKEKFPAEYPNNETIAEKLGLTAATIRDWMQLVEAPKEIQELIAPEVRSGGAVPRGKIEYTTALEIMRKVEKPEKQVSLVKEVARRHVPRRVVRQVIKKVEYAPQREVREIFRESVEAPPLLPFGHEHYKKILQRSKTQTSRKGLPMNMRKGSIARASVTHFADLEVTEVYRKKLGEFDEDDAKREGGYTLNQFKDVWRELHGEWDPDETVNVIRFRVSRVI
jgi:ParB family chromosome partitioning protein